jgi:hypothetical protein
VLEKVVKSNKPIPGAMRDHSGDHTLTPQRDTRQHNRYQKNRHQPKPSLVEGAKREKAYL